MASYLSHAFNASSGSNFFAESSFFLKQVAFHSRGMGMHPFHIPPGSMIRLIKRASSKTPHSPPARWDEWDPALGYLEHRSLPVDYSLRGRLMIPIEIGESMEVLRIERNGIQALGIFRSSPVREIDEFFRVVTNNSIYEVTVLPIHSLKAPYNP